MGPRFSRCTGEQKEGKGWAHDSWLAARNVFFDIIELDAPRFLDNNQADARGEVPNPVGAFGGGSWLPAPQRPTFEVSLSDEEDSFDNQRPGSSTSTSSESAEEKKDKVVLARARRAIQRQVHFRDTPWPEESFMWLEEAACVTERRKRLLRLLSVLGRECATFPSEEGILTGISHLNRAHPDAPFDVAHALSTHKLHYLPGRAGQEAQRHQFR